MAKSLFEELGGKYERRTIPYLCKQFLFLYIRICLMNESNLFFWDSLCYNLPELMMMFREVADIQTADMLNLPVPEAEYRVVTVKPSEIQKEMVEELGNRAERIRFPLQSAYPARHYRH